MRELARALEGTDDPRVARDLMDSLQNHGFEIEFMDNRLPSSWGYLPDDNGCIPWFADYDDRADFDAPFEELYPNNIVTRRVASDTGPSDCPGWSVLPFFEWPGVGIMRSACEAYRIRHKLGIFTSEMDGKRVPWEKDRLDPVQYAMFLAEQTRKCKIVTGHDPFPTPEEMDSFMRFYRQMRRHLIRHRREQSSTMTKRVKWHISRLEKHGDHCGCMDCARSLEKVMVPA